MFVRRRNLGRVTYYRKEIDWIMVGGVIGLVFIVLASI